MSVHRFLLTLVVAVLSAASLVSQVPVQPPGGFGIFAFGISNTAPTISDQVVVIWQPFAMPFFGGTPGGPVLPTTTLTLANRIARGQQRRFQQVPLETNILIVAGPAVGDVGAAPIVIVPTEDPAGNVAFAEVFDFRGTATPTGIVYTLNPESICGPFDWMDHTVSSMAVLCSTSLNNTTPGAALPSFSTTMHFLDYSVTPPALTSVLCGDQASNYPTRVTAVLGSILVPLQNSVEAYTLGLATPPTTTSFTLPVGPGVGVSTNIASGFSAIGIGTFDCIVGTHTVGAGMGALAFSSQSGAFTILPAPAFGTAPTAFPLEQSFGFRDIAVSNGAGGSRVATFLLQDPSSTPIGAGAIGQLTNLIVGGVPALTASATIVAGGTPFNQPSPSSTNGGDPVYFLVSANTGGGFSDTISAVGTGLNHTLGSIGNFPLPASLSINHNDRPLNLPGTNFVNVQLPGGITSATLTSTTGIPTLAATVLPPVPPIPPVGLATALPEEIVATVPNIIAGLSLPAAPAAASGNLGGHLLMVNNGVAPLVPSGGLPGLIAPLPAGGVLNPVPGPVYAQTAPYGPVFTARRCAYSYSPFNPFGLAVPFVFTIAIPEAQVLLGAFGNSRVMFYDTLGLNGYFLPPAGFTVSTEIATF